MTTASDVIAQARIACADLPQVGLGVPKTSRWRQPRIVRAGKAWHLGVLLLTDDTVLATGDVLRAADAGRRGYTSESARERAMRRAQALRGGFREGETVHLGWMAIDLAVVDAGGASGPLAMRDGVPSVRWSSAGGFMPLERYLAERIALQHG